MLFEYLTLTESLSSDDNRLEAMYVTGDLLMKPRVLGLYFPHEPTAGYTLLANL
jgi:hypothetical protein